MKNLLSKFVYAIAMVLLFNTGYANVLPVNIELPGVKNALKKNTTYSTNISFVNNSGAAFTYIEISGIDGNNQPYSMYTLTPLASGGQTNFFVPAGIQTIKVRINTARPKEYGVEAYDVNDNFLYSQGSNDTDDFIFTLPQTFDSSMEQLSLYFNF
jgi:hypothetical protein